MMLYRAILEVRALHELDSDDATKLSLLVERKMAGKLDAAREVEDFLVNH